MKVDLSMYICVYVVFIYVCPSLLDKKYSIIMDFINICVFIDMFVCKYICTIHGGLGNKLVKNLILKNIKFLRKFIVS